MSSRSGPLRSTEERAAAIRRGDVDKETGEILTEGRGKRDAVQIARDRLAQIEANRAKLKELDPDIYRVLEEHKAEFGEVNIHHIRQLESK